MTSPVFLFDPLSGEDWRTWWQAHDATIGETLLSIALVIVVLSVARFAIKRVLHRALIAVVTRAEKTRQRDPEAIKRRAGTLNTTFSWGIDIIVMAIGLALVLGELGFNVTALVAGFGIIGIAVGFGAQTFVKDVINGFFILIEDQYRIGDVVEVSGVVGVVEDINPRRTVLRDLGGEVHFVPNSAIVVATNMTMGYSRINFDLRIGYHEDLDRVIAVVNEECEQLMRDFPADISSPPYVLRVNALSESSVDLKIFGDVRIGEQWRLMGELRHRLKNRFDREGIEIPFPHRTIYHHADGETMPVVAKLTVDGERAADQATDTQAGREQR